MATPGYGRNSIAIRLARLIRRVDGHTRPFSQAYVRELAVGLGACPRTVYRDLDALRAAGFKVRKAAQVGRAGARHAFIAARPLIAKAECQEPAPLQETQA